MKFPSLKLTDSLNPRLLLFIKKSKQNINFLIFLLFLFITFFSNVTIEKDPDTNYNKYNSNTNNTAITNGDINKSVTRLEKDILVLIFPGGKSHNFVMKELFDFSLEKEKKFKYKYHILVHNWDKDFWEKAPSNDYTIYGFGEISLFDKIFNSALDLVRKDPVFGYSKFNKAMIHILDQFMLSGHLENSFRKIQFDMIITDIPNFLFKFLKTELKIPLSMYLSPPALPNLFYNLFEMNPATLPAIGTPFTDELTFFQRLQNSVFFLGTKLMFKIFMGEQVQVFKNYGYNYSDPDVFVYDSLILVQYPQGFCFSISKPPNMIFLNYITPKDPIKIEDEKISNFLNRFQKNIYMSQGTIMKNIRFDKIIKIFEHFSNIGFILSIKKEIADQFVFPKNVFLTHWVNQNDLLGDNRIHLFITHSGINSVLEAIYHEKPVIALGVSLDQVNTAGLVKARETGIVFTSVYDLTPENLIPAIEKTLENNNKYLLNTKKYSKILKINPKATETYQQWLHNGFEIGYQHLLVKAYTNYGFLALNNFDVGFVIFLILLLVLFLIKKILSCIFCYGTSNVKIKKD